MTQEITIEEFLSLDQSNIQLIDVRTLEEREVFSLGGVHIPVDQINQRQNEIAVDEQVIFYCRSGARSQAAILASVNHPNHKNFYNLRGGVIAYQKAT